MRSKGTPAAPTTASRRCSSPGEGLPRERPAHPRVVGVADRGEQQPARRRSRRGHGDELRDEVLSAVNRLLDDWGSDEKLTMRAVAHAVGVTPGSIYLHFA